MALSVCDFCGISTNTLDPKYPDPAFVADCEESKKNTKHLFHIDCIKMFFEAVAGKACAKKGCTGTITFIGGKSLDSFLRYHKIKRLETEST